MTASMIALILPGGIAGLAVWVILLIAIVAIVIVATRAMGVPIPSWVWNILGIVLIAVVAIVAVKFIAGL